MVVRAGCRAREEVSVSLVAVAPSNGHEVTIAVEIARYTSTDAMPWERRSQASTDSRG